MIIGVLKELAPETRVSLIADGVAQLTKKKITVWVETGAGEQAYCTDADYSKAGAEIKSAAEIANGADIVLSIHPPNRSVHSSTNYRYSKWCSVDWYVPSSFSN
ncbi:MAG: hypothetical protein RLZZ390_70 [Bacteroidota bacterium]